MIAVYQFLGLQKRRRGSVGLGGKKTPASVQLRAMAIAALCAALAVLLAPMSFPVGPSKCFPFQHTMNAVTGVLLGPWWAMGSALVASLVRFFSGMGTILAFPGSLFGALTVGLVARFLLRTRWSSRFAALAEPCATGTLGAFVGALIIHPGDPIPLFLTLSPAFLLSSVPGALLGFVVLQALSRVGIDSDRK